MKTGPVETPETRVQLTRILSQHCLRDSIALEVEKKASTSSDEMDIFNNSREITVYEITLWGSTGARAILGVCVWVCVNRVTLKVE